jgi:hypothetical protein
MNSKHLTTVTIVWLLSLSSPVAAIAAPNPDEVWVAIRVLEKGAIQPAGEYYGALDKKVFEETLERTMPSGFLKLRHVAWLENGHIIRLAEPAGGVDYGYGDAMYIRVESVLRIIELDEKFVKERLIRSK